MSADAVRASDDRPTRLVNRCPPIGGPAFSPAPTANQRINAGAEATYVFGYDFDGERPPAAPR
jgi:hypothetical protein